MTESTKPKRRIGRILLMVTGAFVAILIGLFAYASIALKPKVYDVVSIKEATSYQDPALLEQAWALPVAATYQQDALIYQPRVSWCGPTSVANVQVSVGVDPQAAPDKVLEGTGYCRLGECIPGLTLDELAEIAEQKLDGREVTVLRDLSLDEFREHMRHANDPDRRYIINFLRGPLFREGGGHHSPIGGYLEQQDLVFVLDVNESYAPWLVETERLHAAIDTVDGSTDKKRGLLLIQ